MIFCGVSVVSNPCFDVYEEIPFLEISLNIPLSFELLNIYIEVIVLFEKAGLS